MTTGNDLLLEVKGLKTHFFLDEGTVEAVNGVDLTLRRGSVLGVVGESGCGKSVTAFSILQLVSPPGRVVGGQILYHLTSSMQSGDSEKQAGTQRTIDLARLDPDGEEMRTYRGKEIAMIFQEPMVSLSMMHTVGFQIMEAILLHFRVTHEEARQRAINMLARCGIPNPSSRVDAYPFQLSGGMRQRAMIAMALSCSPNLLIADEPTTALDVTTQAQILRLIRELQAEYGMSVMLITHDLGVVAQMCDDVAVMYLGEVVEQAPVGQTFGAPKHPYTQALMRSIPKLGFSKQGRLNPIEGAVPDPYSRPSGCPFHPRCISFMEGRCDQEEPPRIDLAGGQFVRCWLYAQGGEARP
jgi:peptide/nickel transport system ATP-binding protein